MTALDDLANRISKDLPLTEAELSGPQQVLRLQQEQMTALHEVCLCLASAAEHLRWHLRLMCVVGPLLHMHALQRAFCTIRL